MSGAGRHLGPSGLDNKLSPAPLHCSRGEIEVDAAAQVPPRSARRRGKEVSPKATSKAPPGDPPRTTACSFRFSDGSSFAAPRRRRCWFGGGAEPRRGSVGSALFCPPGSSPALPPADQGVHRHKGGTSAAAPGFTADLRASGSTADLRARRIGGWPARACCRGLAYVEVRSEGYSSMEGR